MENIPGDQLRALTWGLHANALLDSEELTIHWSEPLGRHGKSSTGFDFMKQFQQLATADPPWRASRRSACSR